MLQINDKIKVTFCYKNGYGLHALFPTSSGYYVIYQSYHDATEINLGDECEVSVVAQGKPIVRREGQYYIKLYVIVNEIISTKAQRQKITKDFENIWRQYYPKKMVYHKGLRVELDMSKMPDPILLKDFLQKKIDDEDLHSILRKRIWS